MQDTQAIWEYLSSISIGTIIAWVSVIAAIITALCTAAIKLYKLFTKYKEAKDRDENLQSIIESHENTLKKIQNALIYIRASLDEQKDVNLKQIRHMIVDTCEEVIAKGEITTSRLRSLEEMYDEYVGIFHANGYVKTLMERVRANVKIIKEDD